MRALDSAPHTGELVGFTDTPESDAIGLQDVSFREVSTDSEGGSVAGSLGPLSADSEGVPPSQPPLSVLAPEVGGAARLPPARSASFSADPALPSHSEGGRSPRRAEEFYDISTVRVGESVHLVTRVMQVAANTYILTQADERVMGRVCRDMLEGEGAPKGVQDIADTLTHVLEGGGRYCLQMQGGDASLTASRDLAISTLARAMLDPRAAAEAVRTPLSEVFPVGADISASGGGPSAQLGDWGSSAAAAMSPAGL